MTFWDPKHDLQSFWSHWIPSRSNFWKFRKNFFSKFRTSKYAYFKLSEKTFFSILTSRPQIKNLPHRSSKLMHMSLELSRFDIIIHSKVGKRISLALEKPFFTSKSSKKLKKSILSPQNRFSKKCPELQYNASEASEWPFDTQSMVCDRFGVIGYHLDQIFENSENTFFFEISDLKICLF